MILKLKGTITEMKNLLEHFIIRFVQAGKRIHEVEDRLVELIQFQQQKE